MKTVAIIGASKDRTKFGNKALRAFLQAGYRALPITPHAETVEGVKAYPTVMDVPVPIDMATFYVPPDIGEQVIDGVAEKGIGEVWLNPGAESASLVQKARALGIRPILGCSIIGIGMDPGQF